MTNTAGIRMHSRSKWISVGGLAVVGLSDGYAKSAPSAFHEGDWSAHAEFIEPDGTLHLEVGCFIVRTAGETVLIDAGLGPFSPPGYESSFECGHLPEAMRQAGVQPEVIDRVVLSHLHLDHAGWICAEKTPLFPRAVVHFGMQDWNEFVVPKQVNPLVPDYLRDALLQLQAAGRLRPIERDGEAIAPGITSRHTPGHTPGHQCFILSSGTERLIILGDAISCPFQVSEPDWGVITDTDSQLAERTRTALLRELEGHDTRAVGPHFPGLIAGRVLRGEGKAYFSRER